MTKTCLSDLSPGESARVTALTAAPRMRRRLLDLGFTAGAAARCLFAAPSGDPRAYWVRGAAIALRREDAASVRIET